MRCGVIAGHEVAADGRRVWVNAPGGHAVARLGFFGGYALIDVHGADGKECADCRTDLAGPRAWEYFVSSVRERFGVELGPEYRPDWAA